MLRLHDTRTRRTEPVVPQGARVLRMYTCGPTVYRPAHVGNLRAYVFADLVRRVAERRGLRVIACQNVTDVGHLTDDADDGEDKVLAQARREGRSPLEV